MEATPGPGVKETKKREQGGRGSLHVVCQRAGRAELLVDPGAERWIVAENVLLAFVGFEKPALGLTSLVSKVQLDWSNGSPDRMGSHPGRERQSLWCITQPLMLTVPPSPGRTEPSGYPTAYTWGVGRWHPSTLSLLTRQGWHRDNPHDHSNCEPHE